jgi:SHS2 domain-containing protein
VRSIGVLESMCRQGGLRPDGLREWSGSQTAAGWGRAAPGASRAWAEVSGRPLSGYRTLPHTADVVVEAWAPTKPACLAEAVRGLVAVFADTAGIVASRSVVFTLGPAGDEELLVRLLEEAIFLVEVDGVVPVGVQVEPTPDGRLDVRFDVAPVEAAMVIGPVPKAIAWHQLSFALEETGWVCRATIDV